MSGYRTAAERRAYRDSIHSYERTPAWQLRSRRFRVKHGPICDACGVVTGPRNPMHAHHRTYPRALNGKERDKDLRGLCPRCHSAVHALARGRVSLESATDRVIRDGQRAQRRGTGPWRKLWRLITGL